MQNNQNDSFLQNGSAPQPSGSPDMPMKWHKFLIYFSLWLGAVANVGTGIGMLTGSIYTATGSDPETVYSVFEGLKTVDILMGLLSLALAVLLIVTRFSLAGFKANGPKLLMLAYAANAAVALIYPLIAASVTGLSFTELWNPFALVGSVAMIFINKVYYDKRASLFVN